MEPTVGLILSFTAFLVLFLFIGAAASKLSAGTDSDYLLGSRSFGKWLVGLSAGATGNTSFILIAAVGLGYAQGFAAFLLGIAFATGEFCFWTFFAKPISEITEQSGAETVPELAASGIPVASARSVRSVIGVLIFVFVGAYLVAQLAGSAKILSVFFGTSTAAGVAIALVAILAYCTTGGLRASIWTDFVQSLLMIGMTVGMAIYTINAVGGFSALTSGLQAIDPNLLSITGTHTTASLIAFIVGFAFMGCGFGLAMPHVTVRVMAGKNPEEVKQARWIYLTFIYGTWGAMILFGACCRLLLPEVADPEQALPTYAIATFSPWLVGIILAGMFSTIASSADSQILACSSALARDILPGFGQSMSQRFGVHYQYFTTVVTGVVAAIATIYSSSSVFELVVFSMSVLAASLGAAMIIRILNRPTSALCINFALLAGVGVALLWRMQGYHDFLSDVVPGVLSALITHELLARLTGAGSPAVSIGRNAVNQATPERKLVNR